MPRIRKYKRVYKKSNRNWTPKKVLTTDEYIDKYYEEHYEQISKNIDKSYVNSVAGGDDKLAFEKLVKGKMSYENKPKKRKYTVKEAISSVMRSKELNPSWSATDIGEHNLIHAIESEKELKDKFISAFSDEKKISYKRRQRKDRRRKEVVTYLKDKIDVNKMKFEGSYNVYGSNASVYIYDEEVVILIFKSPQKGAGADFSVINKEQWDKDVANNFAVSRKDYNV